MFNKFLSEMGSCSSEILLVISRMLRGSVLGNNIDGIFRFTMPEMQTTQGVRFWKETDLRDGSLAVHKCNTGFVFILYFLHTSYFYNLMIYLREQCGKRNKYTYKHTHSSVAKGQILDKCGHLWYQHLVSMPHEIWCIQLHQKSHTFLL